MCANKSLIGGKEQEVSDDLCLSLDIVDGYGIKFVYMYFVSINYIYIVKDEMFIRTCFVTPCFLNLVVNPKFFVGIEGLTLFTYLLPILP